MRKIYNGGGEEKKNILFIKPSKHLFPVLME